MSPVTEARLYLSRLPGAQRRREGPRLITQLIAHIEALEDRIATSSGVSPTSSLDEQKAAS